MAGSTATLSSAPPLVPPNREVLRAFLLQLVQLTLDELATEAAATLSLTDSDAAAPPDFKLLQLRGLALNGLVITKASVGLGGRTLLTCEQSLALHASNLFPPHQFRTGDLVGVLDYNAAPSKAGKKDVGAKKSGQAALEGTVYQVKDDKIVVVIGQGSRASPGDTPSPASFIDEPELPERIRLLKLSNPTTYTRQTAALHLLLRQLFPSIDAPLVVPSPLISVLLGLCAPKFVALEDQAPVAYLDERLNPSQKEAVRFCLRETNEVALIWGPPGTGKTQTLIEIIRQLVAQGQRVLVCGASNLAIDNIVSRLAPHRVKLTRIGHPARVLADLVPYTLDSQSLTTSSSEVLVGIKTELEAVLKELGSGKVRGKARREKYDAVRDLRRDYRAREGGAVQEVLREAKVVLATCHGAGNRMLANEAPFDVVIIDEAAQAVEPACWIPIMRGKKLILAGDDLQLPPTIKSLSSKTKRTSEKVLAKKPALEKPAALEKVAALDEDAPVELVVAALEDLAVAPEKSLPVSDATEPVLDAPAQILDAAVDVPDISTANGPKSSLRIPTSLSITLFSRLLALHGPRIRKLLNVQYRMNSTIMDFPSQALYDSQLVAHESCADGKLSDLEKLDEGAPGAGDDDEGESDVVFIDTAGCAMYERADSSADSDSKSNENEAELIVQEVLALVRSGIAPSDIGILSPYSAQVTLLSALLHPQYPTLDINSIDSFQGREKEVILLSLVRSNPQREVGFLAEHRRLNVAMTRAKKYLCVVGDSHTVKNGSPYLKQWITWLEEHAEVRIPE